MTSRLVRGHWMMRAGEVAHALQLDGTLRREPFAKLAELTEHLATFTDNAWYPRHLYVQMLDAIGAGSRDEASTREHLMRCGASAAVRSEDVYVNAALRLMTPGLLIASVPKLWALDHQGEETFAIDENDAQSGRAVLRLANAAEYHHVAIVAVGWLTALLRQLRVERPRVEQSGWISSAPAPSEIRFEIGWQ